MLQDLTEEIAFNELQNFFQSKPFVLFGTGTSCAVDREFGMDGLEKYLSASIPGKNLTKTQKKQWDKVAKNIGNNVDLETAMNEVKDKDLIRLIINETAALVVSLDQKYSLDILAGDRAWPAQTLFKRLVDNLPETDRTLHVATTNYDLLAEYAFEQAGIPYTTGFAGGICRCLDWEQAGRAMTCTEMSLVRNKITRTSKPRKHIELYKVHGSLNAFMVDGKMVENNMWVREPSENFERVMITPGMSKYEEIHQCRKELLNRCDESVSRHDAFLFLGFGFNDGHLVNASMKQKLRNYPSLILTKYSNPRIDKQIEECELAWLVCESDNGNGTSIYNSRFDKELIIPNKSLWNPEEFVKEILGG